MGSLKKSTIKGVAWNTIGSVGSGILNLITTMILARLLSPKDFGVLELLVVFSVVSETIIDSGFSQALIRDTKATIKDTTSVFYLNLILGVVIYIILFFSAPLIALFFKEPSLLLYSRVVFLTILFSSLSIIQVTNFNKELDFKSTAISSLTAVVIAGTTAVFIGYKGFGVWALIANLVLFSFTRMILLWFQSAWRPKGGISFESIKKHFAFGSNLLIRGLIDTLVVNLESLLIGRVYTKSELGYVSQGKRLSIQLTMAFANVIQRVTYPALAKIGSDPVKLRKGYQTVIGMAMFIMIPFSFFMFAFSENIIVTLFGAKWQPSSIYLKLSIISGLLVSLQMYFANIFLVLGKSKELLRLSLIKQFTKAIAIIALFRISILALVIGATAVDSVASILYVYFGGKEINYSLKDLFKTIWHILFATSISVVLTYTLTVYISIPSNLLLLITTGLFFSSTYFVILHTLKNRFLSEYISIIKK